MPNVTWNQSLLHKSESIAVTPDGAHLTIHRLHGAQPGPVILLLSGFLSDYRLYFAPASSAGLAPWLASHGYDVFYADWSGKGANWPLLRDGSGRDLHHIITVDLPAIIHGLAELRPDSEQIWVGQGFAAPLLCAAYARYWREFPRVLSMAFFGAYRYRPFQGFARLAWPLARYAAASRGSLNGALLMSPGQREDLAVMDGYCHWREEKTWCDPRDGFDYAKYLRRLSLPAMLYISPDRPEFLQAVRHFMSSLGEQDRRLLVVGKNGGSDLNYSLLSMLNHPKACQDHFPLLLNWITEVLRRKYPMAA